MQNDGLWRLGIWSQLSWFVSASPAPHLEAAGSPRRGFLEDRARKELQCVKIPKELVIPLIQSDYPGSLCPRLLGHPQRLWWMGYCTGCEGVYWVIEVVSEKNVSVDPTLAILIIQKECTSSGKRQTENPEVTKCQRTVMRQSLWRPMGCLCCRTLATLSGEVKWWNPL